MCCCANHCPLMPMWMSPLRDGPGAILLTQSRMWRCVTSKVSGVALSPRVFPSQWQSLPLCLTLLFKFMEQSIHVP